MSQNKPVMSQREIFEKWYDKKTNNNGGVAYYVELWGEYCHEDIQLAWEAWQAACPEGWQAVPVEHKTWTSDAIERWNDGDAVCYSLWKELLQAAPKPGDV